MGSLYIRKVKRGQGEGLWGSYVVDEDAYGVWLYTPEGSMYRGTKGAHVATCYAGWPEPPGTAVIHLIPSTGWWFARWQVAGDGAHVAIDICAPARLVGDVWSYDDLELDLFKFTDGRYGVVDQDEFEEAVALGYISDDERRISLETAAELEGRLAAGDELFDRIGWRNLARCGQQPFEPLVELP